MSAPYRQQVLVYKRGFPPHQRQCFIVRSDSVYTRFLGQRLQIEAWPGPFLVIRQNAEEVDVWPGINNVGSVAGYA